MAHVDDQLMDFVLGTLPERDRAEVALHVGGCSRCQKEAADAAESVALANPPEAPPRRIRRRVLKAADPDRFASRVAGLAELFDLSEAEAKALLEGLNQAEGWEPGPVEGFSLRHGTRGPRLEGMYTGFVRLEPGTRFPHHKHLGREVMFVLEGGFRVDQNGAEYDAGDTLEMAEGTAHSFAAVAPVAAGDEDDCIAAILLEAGVDITPNPTGSGDR
jgi:quercetin dioxygenase-like cupin family protein